MGRPSEESQGFKPDPGNLAVRDYRGASGNVSHGETVNPSCNRKSSNGNPSPTAGRARFLSQWRDGLRKTGHRQLSFVFADSPDGDGEAGVSDVSDGRAFLLHKAKRKITARAVACTAELKPSGNDARISTVLVCRTALRSHEPVAGVEPRGGFRTARFGVLIQRSKEPDAWPAYPVL